MNMKNIIFKNESLKLEFRFSITGYQFPGIESDTDGNWINVKYECFYRDNQFEVVDPSLLTNELKEIYNWFDLKSKNQIPKYTSLSFLEPNLEFILYGYNNNTIRYGIKLGLEAKPPFRIEEFSISDDEDEDHEFIMIFESSLDDFKMYSELFSKLCEEFSQRGS